MRNKTLFLILLAFPLVAFGDPSPLPSPDPGASLGWLQHLIDMIPGGSWAGIPILVVILDTLMRVFKTEQPRSIAALIAKAFHILGAGFDKLAALLDAVLGNNVSQ